ncbi:MAG: acyltransferase [Cryomorphaceae bacterium]|nr:MAG: acyltransferase [Cryomorphaceae bacterium]
MINFLFFKVFKWKVSGNFNLLPEKCVIIVAPHTHWFDFIVCVMVRKIIKVKINFIGKKELFFFPLNIFMQYMGGTAVDRNSKSNTVEEIAKIYSRKNVFRLAISPEGTRKKVEKWKTGFYYIAKRARVPVICVSLNYSEKVVNFSQPFETSSDFSKDINKFRGFFNGIKGKIVEYS